MSTAATSDLTIEHVRVTKSEIIANLADGRVISVPLAWSWRLSEATPAQRANHRLVGGGQGIHWPDIDEDISVEGMLRGTPAPRPGILSLKRSASARQATAPRSANPALQRTGSARR